MKIIPKLISKTKLMRGYQCPKSIYLTLHHKELEPPITPDQQALFDQGNEVGIAARKKFSNGVLIDNKPWDFVGSLKKTRELLSEQTPVIFEAAFEYKGCYARADIIVYSEMSGRWSIFEVKSSTKIKDEHLNDVGLQAWIMANSGLPIEQINIIHLNPACKFPDLQNLFITEDVTNLLRERYRSISPKVTEIFKTIRAEEIPSQDIGPQCESPIECPFQAHCWQEKQIPELSIFNLPKIKERKWDLYQKGILKLDDPKLSDPKLDTRVEGLTDLQQRMIEAYKTGERFVDQKGLKKSISNWKFPLVFLDFETINPAIPRYDQTSPYQQVPFQFSVHIWPSEKDNLIHKQYLHTDTADPRPPLIKELLKACGTKGSIVSYYSQFEVSRLQELADFSKEHKSELLNLIPRFVDPLPLIREFVYDNAFRGSFSLKAVAPALLGDHFSYQKMTVDNGTAAQRAFEELIHPLTEPHRKDQLLQACLDYCEKDTLVMVELVRWIFKIFSNT